MKRIITICGIAVIALLLILLVKIDSTDQSLVTLNSRVDSNSDDLDGLKFVLQGTNEPMVGASTLFAQNASVQLNLAFFGEIKPDGVTCSNGEILKKTGANDWDCATDSGGGGSLEIQNSFVDLGNFTSVSFDAGHFTVTDTTGEATVKLDWGSGGPASLSQAETVNSLWTFSSGASFSTNIEVGGYASISNRLTISKPSITQKGRITGSGTPNFLDQPDEVYISGHYAYIAAGSGTSTDDNLVIVDITNPASPTFEGKMSSAHTPGMSNVMVQGNYAYFTADDSHCFGIVDVRNPSNPIEVSSICGGAGHATLDAPDGLYVAGKYAYVVSSDGATFVIIDISDAQGPTIVGSYDNNTDLAGVDGLACQGNYCYLAVEGAGLLVVMDVTNKTKPRQVGKVAVAGTNNIHVSGKYVYIAAYSQDAMVIVDVSNPASPVVKGSISGAGAPNYLNAISNVWVSGKFAYTVSEDDDSMSIFDVSDVTSPKLVTAVTDGTNINLPKSINVSGRYAYIGTQAGDGMTVMDIGGIETHALRAGTISATQVNISDDLDVFGNAFFNGGLGVGPSGILSNGPLGISVASLSNTLASKSTDPLFRISHGKGYLGGDTMVIDLAASTSADRFEGNFAKFTVAGTPQIIFGSGGEIVGLGAGQFGGTSTVAYSRFGTGTTGHSLAAANDLLISDDFEVDGDTFLDGFASVSSNLEVGGYASASAFKGSAFSGIPGAECSDAGDTLAWAAGLFTCGTDTSSAGSGTTIEVDDGLTDIGSFSSISFEPNSFVVTDTTGEVSVKLDWTTGPASKSAAQTITGLWTFSGGASFSGAVTGTIDTLVRFGATSSVPPSASFATFDTRNDFTVLDFGDSTVASKSIFIDTMPYDYDNGAFTVYIHYSATSATSGDVVWDVQFERVGSGSQDIDTGGWNTANTATCAVPNTSGKVSICSIAFTRAEADGISKGELFRMRVIRDTTDAADTVTATDVELHSVLIVQ